MARGYFNLVQVMKLVAPEVPPKPYRLLETYLTSEGLRTRICSGTFSTWEEADAKRAELQALIDEGRMSIGVVTGPLIGSQKGPLPLVASGQRA